MRMRLEKENKSALCTRLHFSCVSLNGSLFFYLLYVNAGADA